MIRPKALLIDLDGTLVDSRRDIAASCNAALAAFSISALEAESIFTMIGDGARALVARALSAAGSSEEIDRVLAVFTAHYADNACVHTTLHEGAREILSCGIPCAVLTNKPREVTIALLEALGLAPLVADIWAGEGPLKPSPAGVLALCRRLRVQPREVWVIGDGPQDIGAGKAAGAFTVGVPGIAGRDALLAASPDLVVESLADVAHLVITVDSDRR